MKLAVAAAVARGDWPQGQEELFDLGTSVIT